MKRWISPMLLVLTLGAVTPALAADDGGGGGGGGFLCNLWCDILHCSCTIPSGDPSVPSLKDPFCAERKANGKSRCNGAGGGGGGGFIIGQNSPLPSPLVSTTHASSCSDAQTRLD